ncbi:MAG: asparaginase, partial [Frateuria sp.]|nr:asparaginase [Frateuria sp.]
MQHLTIVTTGGTIDKIYFDDKSDYKIGAPQIGEILGQLGVAFAFDVIPILRQDSLHMSAEDRALVRSTIEAQPHRHVRVT